MLTIEGVMRRQGIDKTELAQRLNVSRQTIYSYLKNPSYSTLEKIAAALDVEVFELVEMTNFEPIYSIKDGKQEVIGYLRK